MDIELARTFLEVIDTGNFVSAAKRLNVTQSTVSMRIKALEGELGRPVFVRGKTGAALTPAGQQFQRTAETLVRLWHKARQEIALPPDYRALLSIASQLTLWDPLMVRWLAWMRAHAPYVALKAEVARSDWMIWQLAEGVLDLAVMYQPYGRAGLEVEPLFEETLILVATDPLSQGVMARDYVFVYWSADFEEAHTRAFPEFISPGIAIMQGALALQSVLASGGAGYFPERVVRPLLRSRKLHRLTAPAFPRPVYAVYRSAEPTEALSLGSQGLREVAQTVVRSRQR